MLKRITKTTGLLLCAASVISIMPAKAADVKKIEAQDGTVYNAIAKGTGIYIDGEINDKDEAQYWISADGKYNGIDGLDAGDAAQDLLLNKYLEIDEDTMVDITTNKVIDDNTRADLQDDVATTLRKKIKADNDGRFQEGFTTDGQVDKLQSGAKFLAGGSGLSMYKYTLKTAGEGESQDEVYVDYAGNYVDADYNLGNLKVTTTGDSVTIKNTEDTYEITNKTDGKTYELKAEILEDSTNKYVTDISDSIYRFAKLTIYQREKGTTSWSKAISNTAGNNWLKFGGENYELTGNSDGAITVLQKFSKTPATDAIDGIKYSKDSVIYFIADKDGKSEYILGKSATDAQNKVGSAIGGKVKITGNAQAFCSIYLDTINKKIYAETLKLKSKDGFNYVDISDHDSSDVADNYSSIQTAGGLAWVLDGGYIKAWDGDHSFAKVYKVDGAMNNISVSSKDNIVVWNQDDGVYSVIHNIAATGTTATTTATGTNTTTGTTTAAGTAATTAGWAKANNGTWTYNKADGTKATGWLKDGSTWYYLKADGTMATGWVQDGSIWYYLNASGAMKTGWLNDNGTWYYLNASGAMLANTTVDGYKLGSNGAWIG
jgi:hypothetical protein